MLILLCLGVLLCLLGGLLSLPWSVEPKLREFMDLYSIFSVVCGMLAITLGFVVA